MKHTDKKQLREQRILHAAQKVSRQSGFLTLNVADVARQADVSVGTLYSHFQSKEGLVAALAVHALRGRVATFEAITGCEQLELAEQLVVIVFADFLFSVDYPELFAAEQLGSSTAVLTAVPGGLFRWIPAGELKGSRVEQTAKAAIDTGEFSPWKDRSKQAHAIDIGVWTLMAGSSYIWNVIEVAKSEGTAVVRIPKWLKHNTRALLTGYGWNSSQPEEDIERLAKYSIKKGRFLAPACCPANDNLQS